MVELKDRLIVALDVDSFDEAVKLVEKIGGEVQLFKVGSQLFTACGPVIVRHLMAAGKKIFLDLKYHDIPNTVANAVRSVVRLNVPVHGTVDGRMTEVGGVVLCTLHTLGGAEMLKAAARAAAEEAEKLHVERPRLLGITVLTSEAVGEKTRETVLARATLAQEAGCDGVVASSQEAALLRKKFGNDFVIVTPGIRPAGAVAGDQKRVATPAEAVRNGSDYLVVGRPVVEAADPRAVVRQIVDEISKI